MQMFGKYSGQTIDANWVKSHGRQTGGYAGLIKQNKVNQMTTTTPSGNFPGALNYGKQIEYSINRAGRSSTVPQQVIINWQYMY